MIHPCFLSSIPTTISSHQLQSNSNSLCIRRSSAPKRPRSQPIIPSCYLDHNAQSYRNILLPISTIAMVVLLPLPVSCTSLLATLPLSSVQTQLDSLPRMGIAMLCGALLGMERRAASANAGVRTLSLVSLGAAIFSLTSVYGLGGDPSRMGAAISTGIGFLGSGAINGQNGGSRRQLVTAATIWVAAALGVASACGLYIVALTGTISTLFFLRWRKIWLITDAMLKKARRKNRERLNEKLIGKVERNDS